LGSELGSEGITNTTTIIATITNRRTTPRATNTLLTILVHVKIIKVLVSSLRGLR
jgi:hypothetical protein